MSSTATLTQHPVWEQLQQSQQRLADIHLQNLFDEDSKRASNFCAEGAGVFLDYSKNRIDQTAFEQLLELADQSQLQEHIEQLFSGGPLNNTEQRPALHTALRNFGPSELPEEHHVQQSLDQVQIFVDAIHNGQITGATGQPIETVINLGIGGSDLGPRLVVDAYPKRRQPLSVEFVSSLDISELEESLAQANPHRTLFIISSKSFRTTETLKNAEQARNWLDKNGIPTFRISQHFAAVTANPERAKQFGIDEARIFHNWQWVGGRFSVWSATGLPVALALGMENFNELRRGAWQMDQHFRYSDFGNNLPVLMGLLEVWYSSFWGLQSRAVLPYSHKLRLLPAYLQQLTMESLGKRVGRHGETLEVNTDTVIWGNEGTNSQHSFVQMLMQGNSTIPVDFIVPLKPASREKQIHSQLFASCLAQSRALMTGRSAEQVAQELQQQGTPEHEITRLKPHKIIPGNKPSNTLLLDDISPRTLGALLALYEHKVFVQSVIWNINPFDQWGVELGKQIGNQLHKILEGEREATGLDGSTATLIERFKRSP